MRKKASSNNGIGCLGIIILIVLFTFVVRLYSYCWILAIPTLIYCLKSTKFKQFRIRNSIICLAIIFTSLPVFIWLNIPEKLDSIDIEWASTEFVVGDSITLPIDFEPSDAKIKKVEICNNDIADMEYETDTITLTFKESGEANLYFIANGNIKSDSQSVKVITKEEKELKEQQAIAEAEAKKAEEERNAAEAAEQERLAQEQAAQEQAAQEQAAIAQQNAEDPIVYITNTGSKYHNASCRTLKSKIEKHLSEVRGVYEPCGICHPPQ